tara:strand:- start:7086 stop:7958 length:873 start_codon:yes stop_codon:yes gene_type:complete
MIKQRSGTQQWNGYDDLRGVQKYLGWNTNIVENTQAQGLTAFGSDGFTVGTDDMVNKSSSTYVAFCWKESATAGFDMITYSGTGSAKNESHSLSATPHWIVTKCRSDAQSWATHHRSYSATEKVLYLDNTNALASTDPDWLTAVSSSTISLGGSGSDANVSGRTYVAYLWSEKQGFSKFGSYTGNGNNDGTFVYTGFRPAWGMFKRTDNTADWYIYDNKRNTFNVLDDRLEANENGAETADGGDGNTVDFLSNGFKLRGSGGSMNDGTFIYMAFAEAPFVNSKGVPANAR